MFRNLAIELPAELLHPGYVIHAESLDMAITAKRLVEQAEEQARRIISEAYVKAQQICKESEALFISEQEQQRIAGWEVGYAEGMKRGTDKFLIDHFRALAISDRSTLPLRELLKQGLQEVFRGELSDKAALGAVSRALSYFPPNEPLNIRVNPTQVESVEQRLGAGSSGRVTIVADDAVNVGGCIVQGMSGLINASTDVAIDGILESLEGIVAMETA